ncbi:BQ5605_C026g10174 [Microbotryum silenes-dioicae]|uniref:BQ5605_C026g10174 protein n=1 Tax=Microbotryum silenes-dioicae TaxID=796604 RepID=A0A2X0MQX1_9BASI|nr:BQ5605_C026g10174 [Microbotryum silenes-dioicae]
MGISPALFNIALLTSLSFMLIGYDNGVIGGLTGTTSWNKTFDSPSGSTLSTIVAIYEVGCFFGAVIALSIGERLGRKKSLSVGAVLMTAGALLQGLAYGKPQLIVGRIVSGFGMGLINSTAPVLQAEVSPKASRGRYVCAQLSTLNFGIFLAYWLDYGTTRHYTTSFAFRFPLLFQLVIIVPIFVLSFIVKESPRWLANHGRDEEALAVVAALKGVDISSAEARESYQEIADAVAYEKAVMVTGWKQMFANDEMGTRRRLLIACSIQFFQQLGGINAIIYYANFLFSNSLGFDNDKASLLSGALFTVFFGMSFVPWALIDSLGRKPLLLGSITGMGIIFACMCGATHQIQYKAANSHGMGIFAVVLAFLYLSLFTIGFQATVWVYPPEILPLRIRAKGTALATCCNWIINFTVVEIFPIAIDNIGWKTYILFCVFNFSFVPVIYLFYPETKGKSLEEIDLLFSKTHATNIHEAKAERVEHREDAKTSEISSV